VRIKYSDIFISFYFFSNSMGILINEKRESYIRTRCVVMSETEIVKRVCNVVDFISLALY